MRRAGLHTDVRSDPIAGPATAARSERSVRGSGGTMAARRADLACSVIHRHFRSQDAPLDAILDRRRDRRDGAMAAARAGRRPGA